MESARLDSLEKRTYRAAVDHGFFDLLLAAGVAVFTLVFAVWTWCVLALFALVMGKQWLLGAFNSKLVEPRVGHVRLAPVRLAQISTARKTAALVFFGLAFVVARLSELAAPVVTAAPLVWLADTPQFQMAIIVGAGTAIAGWLFELPRFMAYGVVIVLAPLLAALAGLPAGTGWAVAALIILIAGARVLYRFLSENPGVES